jgi:hypothetical protein
MFRILKRGSTWNYKRTHIGEGMCIHAAASRPVRRWSASLRIATIGAAVIAALAVCVAPAGATVIGHDTFTFSDSETINDCAFPLVDEFSISGQTLLRVDPGGQAFFQHLNFTSRDVITNPRTGRFFVIDAHELSNEIKATLIGGNVYEFTTIEAGQPFVLKDSAGNVIVRDRGVIRRTFAFDTLGDGTPGGVIVGDPVTVLNGPHAGFADDFPFCEIAARLTGA